MTDLVKSVLGGAWTLIVGWILPVFVSLQLAMWLVLPELQRFTAIDRFLQQPSASRQLALLAIAVVTGLVLAAAQTPLYRILEGYTLWPIKYANHRIKKHQARRRRLDESATASARGVRAGLLYERAARYPVEDEQFAPTALGNAIRRFETYAGDRYQLDSQLLWQHLTAAAPDRAVAAVDTARTSVDFFVCLFYGAALTALSGLAITVSGARGTRAAFAIVAGILIAVICYQLAVVATDEWNAAVRAVVDHGRAGVASAFGLTIPANFEDERLMWRAVNTLVRRPYEYSESKNVPDLIKRFRAEDSDKTTAENTAQGKDSPPTVPQLVYDAWVAGSRIIVLQPPDKNQTPSTATDDGD